MNVKDLQDNANEEDNTGSYIDYQKPKEFAKKYRGKEIQSKY